MSTDFKPLITIEYTEYQRLILNQVNVTEGFVMDAGMIMELIKMSRDKTKLLGFVGVHEHDFVTQVIEELKRKDPKFAKVFKEDRYR